MAEVTSGELTVIVLNNVEASALADLLAEHPTLTEDYILLDELASTMMGIDYE